MKYNVFRERILEEIRPLLPEDVEDVFCLPVIKNNGVEYSGLTFRDNTNISPTIYLEPYYFEYLDGRSFENILADIAKTYLDNKREQDFDAKVVLDWEYASSHVVRKLVNYERNKDALKGIPHMKVEDLAVIYQIVVSDKFDEKEYATISVKDAFFKQWNVSLEELDNAAIQNTKRLLPARLDNLAVVYSDVTGVELPFLEEMNLHILTNNLKVNGAVHVLDADIMKHVGEELGVDSYYVIPSTVHEVLVMPYNEEYGYTYLEEVIREVNETELRDVDMLSVHAYVVDAKEGKFMLASKYEEYRKQQELKEKQKELEKESSEPEKKPKL